MASAKKKKKKISSLYYAHYIVQLMQPKFTTFLNLNMRTVISAGAKAFSHKISQNANITLPKMTLLLFELRWVFPNFLTVNNACIIHS